MTLVKFQHPATRSFASLVDELFNDFPATASNQQSFYPPVNIVETADAFHLELSAPGHSKEDFQIEAEKGLLTISYEHKQEEKTSALKVVRREFGFRSFKRSFSLDEKINAENIQARYEHGLLKIFLPKQPEKKPEVQKINIQ